MFKRFRQFLSKNGKDIALIAILFLVPLVCFADVLLQPYTFFLVDIELVQYPGRVFLTDVLREGQLGFWNPYIFMGYPLLAEPEVGPLYPLNLIFALPIPDYYALTLILVFHYSLAGVFSYLLARSLRLSRPASFVSGLVFALSGTLAANLINMNILTGIVWLPLIFCLFSLAIRRRNYGYAIGAGVAISLQILTSHPQIILYSLLVLGFYYLYNLVILPRHDKDSVLGVTFISLTTVLVGAGLAAVQLVPTYQLQRMSTLNESPGYDYVTAYSLPVFRFVTFFFPNFLGNQVVGYRGEPFFEEHHSYIGILPLVLAVLAWGKRRNPQVLFFGLLVPLSYVLALGNGTPLYHLLVHVPVVNWFRIPSRWLLIVTFGLAVLVGYGFDYLLAHREKRSLLILTRWLVVVGVVLTLTLPLLFFYQEQAASAMTYVIRNVYDGQATRTLRALIRGLPLFPDAVQTNFLARLFPALLNPLILFLVLFDASTLLLFFFVRNKLAVRWFQVLAVLLIAFDLFMTGGTTVYRVEEAAYFDKQAPALFLEENVGLYRIFSPDRQGAAPKKLLDYYPMIHRIQSIGTLPSVSVLTPRRYNEFLDALRQNTRLLNLAGVKYIVTESEEPPEWWHNRLSKAYIGDGVTIYENLDVLPRSFIVHQAEVPGSDEAMLALLTGEEFDLSSSILLEDVEALGRLQSLDGGVTSSGRMDKVRVVEYDINRVVIEVEADQAGFLFLSDTHYPGWKAYVDGQKEPIYRADYLFRAVLIPPGEHTVEFAFEPVAFKVGLTITLVTLGAMILAAILSKKGARPSRLPPSP